MPPYTSQSTEDQGDSFHDENAIQNEEAEHETGVNHPRRRQTRNERGRDELKPWTTRQIWRWEEVEAGKFIYLKYYGMWHAGLVTGKSPDRNVVKIVHFALPRLFSSHVVREEEFTVDLVNNVLWEVFVPSNQRVSAAEAVRRAHARIGQRGFNMFFRRSSHVVKECVLRK